MSDSRFPGLPGQAESGSSSLDTLRTSRSNSSPGRRRLLAKRQNSALAGFLEGRDSRLASRLAACAFRLVEYQPAGEAETRYAALQTCGYPRLCQACARIASARLVARWERRILGQDGRLFFGTFTVRDGGDLLEVVGRLLDAERRFAVRRKFGRRRGAGPFRSVVGGVRSIEVKRGASSGLWHPHIHCVWVCTERLDFKALLQEWRECARDQAVSRWLPADRSSVRELLKYNVKFQDLGPEDQYNVFELLRGLRFLTSFGCLFGVKDAQPERRRFSLGSARSVWEWNGAEYVYHGDAGLVRVGKRDDFKGKKAGNRDAA